jgi:hypothetical protein
VTEKRKPILCLDFDGVLHSYTSGWKGADVIPDAPVPGALEFLAEATKHFRVAIFSSRSNQPGGIDAMKWWLRAHINATTPFNKTPDAGPHWFFDIEYPTEKPPAMISIDDRAITFDGAWPSIDFLLAFQPWNKRKDALPVRPITCEVAEIGSAFVISREEIHDGIAVEVFRRRLAELWPHKPQLSADDARRYMVAAE